MSKKLHKTPAKTDFNFYYEQLYSQKNTRRFLVTISIVSILIFLLIFLMIKKTTFFLLLLDHSHIWYNIYLGTFIYFFLCVFSYFLYQISSILFEKKHHHELNKKDLKFFGTIFFFLYKIIHLPWIMISCLGLRLFKKYNIENLFSLIPFIIFGYLSFIVLSTFTLLYATKFCEYLINQYPCLLTPYVNVKTYIYVLVFLTVFICKNIPPFFIKLGLMPSEKKNSQKYKKIFQQYDLLNYYLNVIITLVLKALNFETTEQLLIDALFYTNTSLTLLATFKTKSHP